MADRKDGDSPRRKPSTPRRRKVTVEAEAEKAKGAAAAKPAAEVSPEPPTPPEPAAPPPPAGTASRGPVTLAVAAAIGGLVAVILTIALQSIGILPAPGRAALERVAALESRVADDALQFGILQDQFEQLGDQLNTQINDIALSAAERAEFIASLTGDVTELRALTDGATRVSSRLRSELANAVADLEARLASLAASTADAADGEDATGPALAALASEVDALRAELEQVAAAVAERAGADTDPLAALLHLERRAAGNAPFPLAVEAVREAVGDSEAVRDLADFAATGVASRADLVAAFDDVLAAMGDPPGAEPAQDAEPETGLARFVEGWLGDAFTVRPAGEASPSDGDEEIEAMAEAVARGDLEGAMVVRARLSGEQQRAVADWGSEARRRIALDRLVAAIVDSHGREPG